MSASTIVLLNLPPNTFIGINLVTFSSTPNFCGTTGIPPGLNLVYTGTDASLSIRHGTWLDTSPSRSGSYIHTLEWDAEQECLVLLKPDHEAAQRAARGLSSLQGRGLVDYTALRERTSSLQQEQSTRRSTEQSSGGRERDQDAWFTLTSHVTPRLLSRLLNSTRTWTLTSLASTQQDAEAEHIPGLSQHESSATLAPYSTLNVSRVNLKQTWPDSAVGGERTEKAQDRSWYLGHLIRALSPPATETRSKTDGEQITQRQAASELLGELQFCYVAVLTLANWSCLEQWKRLLSVLCTCRSALTEVEGFFVEVVTVLKTQLSRVEDVEGGLFEMADEHASAWLRQLLRRLRRNVDEVGAEKVSAVLEELEYWLREQYGWEDERNMLRRGTVQLEDGEEVEFEDQRYDEEDELGEYAPVVVDT